MTEGQTAEGPQEHGGDWIDARIGAAAAAKPVPDATVSTLKDAMRVRMAERGLPASELTKLAKEILTTLGWAAK